ncbi:hypothetical protein [Streptomyces sp. NEAU-S7GS2]|nr:hypothetical protein [Streptomyces sp. NEAU-S7GS2]
MPRSTPQLLLGLLQAELADRDVHRQQRLVRMARTTTPGLV